MKRDPEGYAAEDEGSKVDSHDFDSDNEASVLPSTNHTQQSLKVDADHEDHEELRSKKEDHEEEVSGEQNDETGEVDKDDDCDDNMDGTEDGSDMGGDTDVSDEEDREELNSVSDKVEDSDDEDRPKGSGCKVHKRKLSDYIGQDDAADASLGAPKRFAGAKKAEASTDRIFSDEDFKRIGELKAKREARLAFVRHGLSKGDTPSVTLKLPSSDEFSMKRVDPSHLEAPIKMSKEKRLELVKAGREDRGKYQARAVIKKKKTGGSSNKQKQHQKSMPLAAKRGKAARSRQQKRTKAKHPGKQFRGRKAWK